MINNRLQSCVIIAGYFAYLVLGALVFQALEKDAKAKQENIILRIKESFLKNITSFSPAKVELFVENLMDAVGKELRYKQNNWDFSNSFFFVGSMLATIGYGNISPKTAGGQLFCVFFALFGIPLNIVFLNHIGNMIAMLCERLAKWLYEKGVQKKTTRCLTLLFFLVMGILMFLCLPSAVFREMEGWTYGEAIYFAFITLSTIGFGDYIIGKASYNHYNHFQSMLCIVFW
uniref:Potassium channel domain-containing protein n=1 Tax=Anolis carolinensis TaxID=28377 RepID=R4GA87_ANOCA